MELDHIFICVPPEATEAELLSGFGFSEGSRNTHPGQGSANRRFFFYNTFIELLYLRDIIEAKSELTRPTNLYDRLIPNNLDASPFGVCFRPSTENEKHAPFPSWEYNPIYLPKQLHVEIAESPVVEPMWFYLDFACRPDSAPEWSRQPMDHPNGLQMITSVEIEIPGLNKLSSAAEVVSGVDNVKLVHGTQHLITICFDGVQQELSKSFLPHLPLSIKW